MKTLRSLLLLVVIAGSFSSCVVRERRAGWVPGHYEVVQYGRRHWIPAHYR